MTKETKEMLLWAASCVLLGMPYYWVLQHPPKRLRWGDPLILELPSGDETDEEELMVLDNPADEPGASR